MNKLYNLLILFNILSEVSTTEKRVPQDSFVCGDSRSRTDDPLLAGQVL